MLCNSLLLWTLCIIENYTSQSIYITYRRYRHTKYNSQQRKASTFSLSPSPSLSPLAHSLSLSLSLSLLWNSGQKRIRAASFLTILDHTQRRVVFGKTPLDEWSARRKDLYLTTHTKHSQHNNIHASFRTHNLSKRQTTDLRFRQCGHWGRQSSTVVGQEADQSKPDITFHRTTAQNIWLLF